MTPSLYVGASPQLPDDAELELLTEYVGGFMTETEAEAFEERLVDDEDFFVRVSPLLDAWYAPGVLPIEREIAERLVREDEARRQVVERHRRRFQIRGFVGLAAAAALGFAMLRPAQQTPEIRPTVTSVTFPPPPRAPAVVVAPVPIQTPRRPRQVAVRPPTPIEVPIMRAVDDSMRVELPAAQYVAPKVSADADSLGRTITVVAAPLDTAYQNAEERMRELIEMEKKAAADALKKRPIWMRLPQLIGGVFHGKPQTAKPPSKVP